jgi:hypothetical protein
MNRATFDALKRILERARPREFDPKHIRNDWLQVVNWLQEAEEELDDVESLGTDDPRAPSAKSARAKDMDEDTCLQMQISDMILDVANSYPTATTSDLQGMADVAARKIVELIRRSFASL